MLIYVKVNLTVLRSRFFKNSQLFEISTIIMLVKCNFFNIQNPRIYYWNYSINYPYLLSSNLLNVEKHKFIHFPSKLFRSNRPIKTLRKYTKSWIIIPEIYHDIFRMIDVWLYDDPYPNSLI